MIRAWFAWLREVRIASSEPAGDLARMRICCQRRVHRIVRGCLREACSLVVLGVARGVSRIGLGSRCAAQIAALALELGAVLLWPYDSLASPPELVLPCLLHLRIGHRVEESSLHEQ